MCTVWSEVERKSASEVRGNGHLSRRVCLGPFSILHNITDNGEPLATGCVPASENHSTAAALQETHRARSLCAVMFYWRSILTCISCISQGWPANSSEACWTRSKCVPVPLYHKQTQRCLHDLEAAQIILLWSVLGCCFFFFGFLFWRSCLFVLKRDLWLV